MKGISTTSESEHEVEGRLLLNVVIGQSPAVLKLLASEDEALLIGRNALLVLDLSLDILDGVGGLHVQGDGLASESLHEDLHTATKSEDQVESGLLLDVVVREGSAVLQLLACKDQSLLVRGDALLVLNLGLDVLNRVRGLHIECDGLAGKGLDENLHSVLLFLKVVLILMIITLIRDYLY